LPAAPHRLKPESKIGPVLDALAANYDDRQWHGGDDPLSVLIRGVLSQNTSDVNSGRAWDSLMAEFGDWGSIARATPRRIARAIRSGGLADQKARTIKAVLRWVREEKGAEDGHSLNFLQDLDVAEAERRLTSIKGVGIKTARLTLLFGFGRETFVVDTHVLRVSRRLGLVPEKCGREKAHVLLDDIVPPERKYAGHLHMIAHGRQTCHPRSPACGACPVSRWCVYVRKGTGRAR
jgi:endonuclease-3